MALIEGSKTAAEIHEQLAAHLPLRCQVKVHLGWPGVSGSARPLAAARCFVGGRVELLRDYPVHLIAPPSASRWKLAG